MPTRIWKNLTHHDSSPQPAEKKVLETKQMDIRGEGSIRVCYRLNGFWQQENPFENEGYMLLDIPQAGFTDEPGSPMLAREGLFVVIPANAEYSSLSVENLCPEELPEEYDLLPVPRDVLETEELIFDKNSDVYGVDEQYPQTPVKYIETTDILGVRCVHLAVCPFQYYPRSRKLTALRKIVVTVNYTIVKSAYDISAKANLNMIDNTHYYSQLLGYQQDDAKNPSDSKPRMIIVTSEKLAYSLRILEGVKNFLYDVEVVYIEKIKDSYNGNDSVEKIHKFLLAEHAKRPLSYVILGGVIDIIPSKMVDDNGDPNGDDLFPNDNYYCSNDPAKPIPLFALGRLPVSSVEEMNKVADYASYYNRFYNDKRKNAVFTSYNDPSHGYEQCKRDIKSTLTGDFSVTECYDGQCSKETLIKEINNAVGFINYRGHGDYDRWQSGNGLSVKDIPTLDVKRNTPHVLSIACNNCSIHKSGSFGVEWIKQLKAISFLGASAPSYTTVNHVFDKYLWEGIHQKKITKIGDIFVWATLELYRNKPDRHTITNILEYLLLGDPSADYMDGKPDK